MAGFLHSLPRPRIRLKTRSSSATYEYKFSTLLKGAFAKNGSSVMADIEWNLISINTNFNFICCIYKEKMAKNAKPKSVASIYTMNLIVQ